MPIPTTPTTPASEKPFKMDRCARCHHFAVDHMPDSPRYCDVGTGCGEPCGCEALVPEVVEVTMSQLLGGGGL
jgi:hypothetical protein